MSYSKIYNLLLILNCAIGFSGCERQLLKVSDVASGPNKVAIATIEEVQVPDNQLENTKEPRDIAPEKFQVYKVRCQSDAKTNDEGQVFEIEFYDSGFGEVGPQNLLIIHFDLNGSLTQTETNVVRFKRFSRIASAETSNVSFYYSNEFDRGEIHFTENNKNFSMGLLCKIIE